MLIQVLSPTLIQVDFSVPLQVEGVSCLSNYLVTSVGAGVPVKVLSVTVVYDGPPEDGIVLGVQLSLTEGTAGEEYLVQVQWLKELALPTTTYQDSATYIAQGDQVRLLQADYRVEDGGLTLTFSKRLREAQGVLDTANYTLTGPGTATIVGSHPIDGYAVALDTLGVVDGSYSITVASSIKDTFGTPIDPGYRVATFTGAVPEKVRSIFTDHGPIAKPPEVLQSGTGVTINTYMVPVFGPTTQFTSDKVTLTGGLFTANHIGLDLEISGTSLNNGTYKVLGIVGSAPTNQLRVRAEFRLPDSGTGAWSLIDPKDGAIADSSSDVRVLVNGSSVTPEKVNGLLGQIVLPTMPISTDTVSVSYSWVQNPTVDFGGLNTPEYTLNCWSDDVGRKSSSQHLYKYRTSLREPSLYLPDSLLAPVDQPQLRDLFYRGTERAYSAITNDSQLLELNTPSHQIGYPPLKRDLVEANSAYEAALLPENSNPVWVRVGGGVASTSAGSLQVEDNSTGPYPNGNPIFWTQGVDLSYGNTFAATWRMQVLATPSLEGIFTGISVGWSSEKGVVVLGYLLDGGVPKLGLLKRGYGNDPSSLSAWGGVDLGVPVGFDWSTLHSYRFLRSSGIVRVYVDGEVVETLRISESDLPALEELPAPFNEVQGVFFGSLSRTAQSTSSWDFLRYQVIPANPEQIASSISVDYDGITTPEVANPPWVPLGYHGTETLSLSGTLILDSTAATDRTEGLVGGEYRCYSRVEPLLSKSASYSLDFDFQGRSWTHGIRPDSLSVLVDDGTLLTQISFLSKEGTPKISYPGKSLPEEASPEPWGSWGSAPVEMLGRTLRITDTSLVDGRVYTAGDYASIDSPQRVLGSSLSYSLEARLKVLAHTADPQGFSGVSVEAWDGTRNVGILLQDLTGTKKVAFHSNGSLVPFGSFAFNWGDNREHTYKVSKSVTLGTLIREGFTGDLSGNTLTDLSGTFVADTLVGDHVVLESGAATGIYPVQLVASNTQLTLGVSLNPVAGVHYKVYRGSNLVVSLFADTTYLGSIDYESCAVDNGAAAIAFGTSTMSSSESTSTVDFVYVNGWRNPSQETLRYVGIWKGFEGNSLVGYHLPLKASGVGSTNGSTLEDLSQDFSSVVEGDLLLVDSGPNQGTYSITAVGVGEVTVSPPIPNLTTEVYYRVPKPIDWASGLRTYRIVRDPGGAVALFVDSVDAPEVTFTYSEAELPSSAIGTPYLVWKGLPSVTWGALDPENLSQSEWSYLRYLVTSSPVSSRIVPEHQVLNQVNVMSSPEHISGSVPHNHTQFDVSSTGHPFPWEEYVAQARAYTQLNEGTPLVPSTQSFEVRRPTPVFEPVADITNLEDVLEGGHLSADGSTKISLLIPDDVLYNNLQVIETSEGELDLLAPAYDSGGPSSLGVMTYTNPVYLTYDANTLPEDDSTAPTPWVLSSEGATVSTISASSGILTYGASGGQTLYYNNTPLTDPVSLDTEISFNIKVDVDGTFGSGDTGIRVGFSAFGLTAALAFITTSLGDREVRLLDLNENKVLGAIPFDFEDGAYHTYRLLKNVSTGTIDLTIDP